MSAEAASRIIASRLHPLFSPVYRISKLHIRYDYILHSCVGGGDVVWQRYGLEVADIITASPDKTDSASAVPAATVSTYSKAAYTDFTEGFIEKQHDKSYG